MKVPTLALADKTWKLIDLDGKPTWRNANTGEFLFLDGHKESGAAVSTPLPASYAPAPTSQPIQSMSFPAPSTAAPAPAASAPTRQQVSTPYQAPVKAATPYRSTPVQTKYQSYQYGTAVENNAVAVGVGVVVVGLAVWLILR